MINKMVNPNQACPLVGLMWSFFLASNGVFIFIMSSFSPTFCVKVHEIKRVFALLQCILYVAARSYKSCTYRTHTFIGRISYLLAETSPCIVGAGLAPALENMPPARSRSNYTFTK